MFLFEGPSESPYERMLFIGSFSYPYILKLAIPNYENIPVDIPVFGLGTNSALARARTTNYVPTSSYQRPPYQGYGVARSPLSLNDIRKQLSSAAADVGVQNMEEKVDS